MAQGDVTLIRTSPTHTSAGTTICNEHIWTYFAGWKIGGEM